ncbi:prepilin-type N-terminal cleavage/methylation domain-containing protein [Patescibacteria group bacterium]|nr:prepilin-type N-terminal cleavage/methylation domain-containing protein [Patescibacteria group bacterium]
MNKIQLNNQSGLTIIEIMIAVSVVVVLAALSFQVFNVFIKRQALDKDTQKIVSMLKEARSATLASRANSVYGVHFVATRTVMFKGTVFIESDSNNRELSLNPRVQITVTNLNGGGSDIIFDRLTGATDQYGSITLSLVASTSITKIISIEETGIVEF